MGLDGAGWLGRETCKTVSKYLFIASVRCKNSPALTGATGLAGRGDAALGVAGAGEAAGEPAASAAFFAFHAASFSLLILSFSSSCETPSLGESRLRGEPGGRLGLRSSLRAEAAGAGGAEDAAKVETNAGFLAGSAAGE